MVTPSVRIVDVRVLAVLVSRLAKWLPVRLPYESSYIVRDGGASDKSVTTDSPPSGVDYVRDFGDTKMALLGSSLGAVFAGSAWDIRCAGDLSGRGESQTADRSSSSGSSVSNSLTSKI